MRAKAMDFFVYVVKDMTKARDFYENVLKLQPMGKAHGNWMEYDVGGRTLALRESSDAPGAAVALAVDNVAETVTALEAQGVTIALPTGESPSCHTALILDPDGNPILVHRRKDGSCG